MLEQLEEAQTKQLIGQATEAIMIDMGDGFEFIDYGSSNKGDLFVDTGDYFSFEGYDEINPMVEGGDDSALALVQIPMPDEITENFMSENSASNSSEDNFTTSVEDKRIEDEEIIKCFLIKCLNYYSYKQCKKLFKDLNMDSEEAVRSVHSCIYGLIFCSPLLSFYSKYNFFEVLARIYPSIFCILDSDFMEKLNNKAEIFMQHIRYRKEQKTTTISDQINYSFTQVSNIDEIASVIDSQIKKLEGLTRKKTDDILKLQMDYFGV